MHDRRLYDRGIETLVASWEAYARGSTDAAVHRLPGVAAAVFPSEPERDVYNNAVLERGLSAGARAEAIEAMEAGYAAAGVERFAVWAHESETAVRHDLEGRGYRVDTTTRAMGMPLDDLSGAPPHIEAFRVAWSEYLRVFGLPPDLLGRADLAGFRLLAARVEGELASVALAFDHRGDCGLYNVGTVEHLRRRGIATALTALQLHEARTRGCLTASIQSTEMAERVYASVGFRDLGRIIEYVRWPLSVDRLRRSDALTVCRSGGLRR